MSRPSPRAAPVTMATRVGAGCWTGASDVGVAMTTVLYPTAGHVCRAHGRRDNDLSSREDLDRVFRPTALWAMTLVLGNRMPHTPRLGRRRLSGALRPRSCAACTTRLHDDLGLDVVSLSDAVARLTGSTYR